MKRKFFISLVALGILYFGCSAETEFPTNIVAEVIFAASNNGGEQQAPNSDMQFHGTFDTIHYTIIILGVDSPDRIGSYKVSKTWTTNSSFSLTAVVQTDPNDNRIHGELKRLDGEPLPGGGEIYNLSLRRYTSSESEIIPITHEESFSIW